MRPPSWGEELAPLLALWYSLIALGPTLLRLAVVVVVGLVLTRVFQRVVRFVAQRVGLDAVCERVGVTSALKALGQARPPSALLARLAGLVGLALVLFTAADVAGLTGLRAMLARLLAYLPNLLVGALMAGAGVFLGQLARRVVFGALSRNPQLEAPEAISRAVEWLILIVALAMAAQQLGLEIALIHNMILIVVAGALIAVAITLALGALPMARQLIARYYVTRQLQLGDALEVLGQRGTLAQFAPTGIVMETSEGRLVVPYALLVESVVKRR